jgi:hypothetical protein
MTLGVVLVASLVGAVATSVAPGSALAGEQPDRVGAPDSRMIADPGALPTLLLSPSLGPPGASIQVRGAGFQCAATVYLDWLYAQGSPEYLGSISVNHGSFSISITVPAESPDGTSHVRARSMPPGCSAQASFRVCRFCQESLPEFGHARR